MIPTTWAPDPRTALVLGLLLVCPAAFLDTPLAAQAVEGHVVGAREGAPVPGAVVRLLDGAYNPQASTVTDDEGRFHLEAPAPGTYFLLLERPDHASELSAALTLEDGETVAHRMEVEGRSARQMAALREVRAQREALTRSVLDQCAGTTEGRGGAMLTGVVRDSTSGVALPGLRVVVEWQREGEGSTRRSEIPTGGDGAYIACGLPAGDTVSLAVQGISEGAPLAALVLEAGVVHRLDLPVDAATFGATVLTEEEPMRLFGRVMEYGTGQPVEGASVRLGEDGPVVLSGPTGFFSFQAVEPGSHLLSVEHLGYGSRERMVRVRPRQSLRVDVVLAAEAIELEGIEVSVESRAVSARMAGFYTRMDDQIARGSGEFVLREEIDEHGNVPVSALLRGRGGIQVRRTRGGYIPVFRRAWRPTGGDCRPVLYLDNHKIGTDYATIDMVPSVEIEAIEIYKSAAQVPGEFSGSDAGCGVIAIWTR